MYNLNPIQEQRMFRKINSAIALLALGAVILVGCGKEDVADLEQTWTTQEGDLLTKLQDVQAKQGDLYTSLTTSPAAMNTDSAVVAERQLIEQKLTSFQERIASVEQTISDFKQKRQEATEAGNRATYETAWTEAKTAYETAMTDLNAMMTDLGTIESQIASLDTVEMTTEEMPADVAVDGTDNSAPSTDGPEEPAADTSSN
jgi:hypothetical protein